MLTGRRQLRKKLPRGFARDDVRLRSDALVAVIPLRVVPVEVRVDDVAHRLGSDLAPNLRYQRDSGGGLRVRVDDQQVARILENRGVRIDERHRFGDGGIDPVGDLLDGEQILRRATGRLGARLVRSEHALLEQRGSHP